MSSKLKTSIFKTERFLAMEIFQNHIDELHALFDQFCAENKGYQWHITINNKTYTGITNIEKNLNKNAPTRLHYTVTDATYSRTFTVEIDNGVTLNIKNGTHSLYGLFKQVVDMSPNMNAPPPFCIS